MKGKIETEFFNKNILITGASSGVGLYSSIYFLNNNANVIMICQDKESVEKFCKERNFSNAYIFKADLEKQSQLKEVIKKLSLRFKNIDILINCAGIKLDTDLLSTHSEDFDFTMRTNLRPAFVLIKELIPYFNRQGTSIINMSCLYGSRPVCGFISYAMSKAGLESLTKYAAAEYAYLNIRINAISACPINTNSLRYIGVTENEIEDFNKKMEKNIPLGRIAEGHDIIKAIVFLASKRSKKITGQIIKVDGGRSLTSSGYVHYKGMLNMNSKLEPDGERYDNFKRMLSFGGKLYNLYEKKRELPIKNKDELKKFVEETIKESKFSTRNMEAIRNVNNLYYPVKNNNDYLEERFLKGQKPQVYSEKKPGQKKKINIYNIDKINNIDNFINKNNIFNKNNKNNINNNIYLNNNINDLKPDEEEIFIPNNKTQSYDMGINKKALEEA